MSSTSLLAAGTRSSLQTLHTLTLDTLLIVAAYVHVVTARTAEDIHINVRVSMRGTLFVKPLSAALIVVIFV